MQQTKTVDDFARRGFFTRIGLIGFFASLGMTTIGGLRFLFPKLFYEPRSKFRVGRPNDFPKGRQRFLEDRKVFVFHDDAGFHVVSAICTHLGCIATKTPEGFKCPCHGSNFDAAGRVIGGPAPRPLPWLKVSLSPSGYLVVDTTRTVDIGTKFRVT